MTDLLRPDLVAKTPLRVWLAATLTGAITGGLLVAAALSPHPAPPAIVAAPAVSLVPAPPTMVVMKTGAPVPAPPTVTAHAPAAIRATAPWLDAACVLRDVRDERPVDDGLAACDQWDSGFPAISKDGTTVAALVTDDDGGRGNANFRVELIDVATSKVTRTYVLLDADEYELGDDAAAAKLLPRVKRRTTAAQKALAGYRAMTLVPVVDMDRDENPDEPTVLPTTRYAELAADRLRIVEPATATSTAAVDITVESPLGTDIEECSQWYRLDATLAIDDATGIALVSQDMRTGGCLCPDVSVRMTKRIAR